MATEPTHPAKTNKGWMKASLEGMLVNGLQQFVHWQCLQSGLHDGVVEAYNRLLGRACTRVVDYQDNDKAWDYLAALCEDIRQDCDTDAYLSFSFAGRVMVVSWRYADEQAEVFGMWRFWLDAPNEGVNSSWEYAGGADKVDPRTLAIIACEEIEILIP